MKPKLTPPKMRSFVNATKKITQISPPCDQRLRERLWKQDNAEFIAAYNQTITDEGLPLDTWQSF